MGVRARWLDHEPVSRYCLCLERVQKATARVIFHPRIKNLGHSDTVAVCAVSSNFTVLMPISGRLLQRGIHPRVLSIIGSLFVGAGWMLSRYASDINLLYLTYGVIAGAGVGIVYGI